MNEWFSESAIIKNSALFSYAIVVQYYKCFVYSLNATIVFHMYHFYSIGCLLI